MGFGVRCYSGTKSSERNWDLEKAMGKERILAQSGSYGVVGAGIGVESKMIPNMNKYEYL